MNRLWNRACALPYLGTDFGLLLDLFRAPVKNGLLRDSTNMSGLFVLHWPCGHLIPGRRRDSMAQIMAPPQKSKRIKLTARPCLAFVGAPGTVDQVGNLLGGPLVHPRNADPISQCEADIATSWPEPSIGRYFDFKHSFEHPSLRLS
jgi:hypothetical protein